MTPTSTFFTLSLHDALPISIRSVIMSHHNSHRGGIGFVSNKYIPPRKSWDFVHVLALELPRLSMRSEEHTSELQSPVHTVCRLLPEKKKKDVNRHTVIDGII